jgi:hypothetical protein
LVFALKEGIHFKLPTIPLDEPKRLLKKGWDKATKSIQNVKSEDGKIQYIYYSLPDDFAVAIRSK